MEALEGEFHTTQRAGNYVGGMIIWSGAAFWYFWKSLNRRGWVGALVGMAISLLVLFGGAGISGYVKGQRADILDQVPQFAALKRNFPEAAEQVRQDYAPCPRTNLRIAKNSQLFCRNELPLLLIRH